MTNGKPIRPGDTCRPGQKVAVWVNDGTPAGAWFYARGHGPDAANARFLLRVVVLQAAMAVGFALLHWVNR